MKKLMLILFLSSLCLGQFLPSDEDLVKMSTFEKQMLYETKAKSPMMAMAWQSFIPSIGYAYIDDWKRGLKFTAIEISLCIVGLISIDWSDYAPLAFWGPAGILHLYQYADLYKETNKYNERLHNKIFDKKDNNFSFLILPTSNGAYLNLSYKF